MKESKVLEALNLAKELVTIARQHFPKSIRNSDTFKLELTSAAISTAIQEHNALVNSHAELLAACQWMMAELCEAWDESEEKAIPQRFRDAIAKAANPNAEVKQAFPKGRFNSI